MGIRGKPRMNTRKRYRSDVVVRFFFGALVAFGGAAAPGPCDSSLMMSSFGLSAAGLSAA
jgi:hypothetical protein